MFIGRRNSRETLKPRRGPSSLPRWGRHFVKGLDRDLPDRLAGVRADPVEVRDFSDHIGSNAALITWFGTLVAVDLQARW